MSQIKINRAMALAAVGRFPATASAMLDHVPHQVVGALTSRQLASLLDGLWEACRTSKTLAVQDALWEGAIYDPRTMRLREIAA